MSSVIIVEEGIMRAASSPSWLRLDFLGSVRLHDTPIPGVAWNPSTETNSFDKPRARAASTMALPTGCSLAPSAAAAIVRTESLLFLLPCNKVRLNEYMNAYE